MCTHKRPERDDEMLSIGIVESGEKIEAQRVREIERERER